MQLIKISIWKKISSSPTKKTGHFRVLTRIDKGEIERAKKRKEIHENNRLNTSQSRKKAMMCIRRC